MAGRVRDDLPSSFPIEIKKPRGNRSDGTSCTRHRWHARHWRGHLHCPAGRRRYSVAANYAGNDEKAKAFTDETGIASYKFDVSDFDACMAAWRRSRLRISAGSTFWSTTPASPVTAHCKRMSREDWDAVIDTNLGGCFNMVKAVFDGMKERKFGRIVNIGSINGQAGQYGQVNYAAAKSGIHGFTKALARKVRATTSPSTRLHPGYIDTDMVAAVPANVLEKIVAKIPVGRLGHAEEIARGVCFLRSARKSRPARPVLSASPALSAMAPPSTSPHLLVPPSASTAPAWPPGLSAGGTLSQQCRDTLQAEEPAPPMHPPRSACCRWQRESIRTSYIGPAAFNPSMLNVPRSTAVASSARLLPSARPGLHQTVHRQEPAEPCPGTRRRRPDRRFPAMAFGAAADIA